MLAAVALDPVWPAPPNPMALTRFAGLTPETHEFVFLHVHSHLDVFFDGKKVVVPAGIGIDIRNPAVRKFPQPDGTIATAASTRPARSRASRPCTHIPTTASSTRRGRRTSSTGSGSSSRSGRCA
jgi:hypothetical protein